LVSFLKKISKKSQNKYMYFVLMCILAQKWPKSSGFEEKLNFS